MEPIKISAPAADVNDVARASMHLWASPVFLSPTIDEMKWFTKFSGGQEVRLISGVHLSPMDARCPGRIVSHAPFAIGTDAR